MIIIDFIEQRTEEWFTLKLGVISASKAFVLLMKDKKAPFPDDVVIETIKRGVNTVEFKGETYTGNKTDCVEWFRNKLPLIRSDVKQAYLNELVGCIATKKPPPEIFSKTMRWGEEYEEEANKAFCADNSINVNSVGFIYRDKSKRAGCSPDGLIDGEIEGLELKCPTTAVFIDFMANGRIKKEEIIQCQFSMWVTDYKYWWFAKYDPRNVNCKKLHYVKIKRDEEMIKKISDGYDQFVIDMDIMLKNANMKFGQQWEH